MTSEENPARAGASTTDSPVAERKRSAPYPRASLEAVENAGRIAFSMGARHCDQDSVAEAVGFKNATNGAFRALRAAGQYFGLFVYQDDKYLSVSQPWIEALHEDTPAVVDELRKRAVREPDLYRRLIAEFDGKQLPSQQKLARHLYLNQRFGIVQEASETAARVFLESVAYAGLVDANNYLRVENTQPGTVAPTSSPSPSPQAVVATNTASVASASAGGAEGSAVNAPDVDRIEVVLEGGRRAILHVPVPLRRSEKERLKKYLDLVLEPDEENTMPHIAG